ncbi:hypothetical protein GUJ93_ZPchr0006g42247 [Zizania palustris]|uniref:Uncharacterized protein n=1 Tax=Zizania palustris TaxID=103762 RepID=A0A8J5W325_ZIZPA|nr:hypothetical protein GUJ93_ZPchr0006g42247 [Zizania palustris]
MWTDLASGMVVRAMVPVEEAGGLWQLPASGGSVNSRIEEIHGEVMVAVGLAMGPFGGVVAVVGEEGVVSHMLGGVPQVVDGETDIWSRILPEKRIRRFVS